MTVLAPASDLAVLRFDEVGLLPVVAQDVATGAVLMVAWADREAVERTLASGEAWFWSRSRQRLWKKGETSGNVLAVVEVRSDCDGDTLLYRVDPAGPACHRGTRTCFDGDAGLAGAGPAEAGSAESGTTRAVEAATGSDGAEDVAPSPCRDTTAPRLELGWLWEVLEQRRSAPPEESYTARLVAAGVDRVARKVGEEATETVIAALRAADAGAASSGAASTGAASTGAASTGTASTGTAAAGTASAGTASAGTAAARAARAALVGEAGDLLYHLLVLLMAAGAAPEEVAAELRRRHAAPVAPRAAKPEDGAVPSSGPDPAASAGAASEAAAATDAAADPSGDRR